MAKKTTKRPIKAEELPKARKLKAPKYKSFRLHRRIKHPQKISSGYSIFKSSVKLLAANWKPFFILALIYGILTIFLVRGFGGGLQLNELKSSLRQGFGGSFAELTTGLTLFGYILGSAGGSQSEASGLYQLILMLVFSLAIIWAIRKTVAGQTIRAKESLYSGMYPLVPFTLVLGVIGLQFIPLITGSWLYGLVINNSIAATTAEQFLWALVFLSLAVLSFYMLCSSVFALYIVTLPDMKPIKALRSARQLVLHRRWMVMRKIMLLPICLLVVAAVITVPFILFATFLAEWVFFALSMFVIVIVHTYIYTLYRELL